MSFLVGEFLSVGSDMDILETIWWGKMDVCSILAATANERSEWEICSLWHT
jgi:hypothetical protein